MPRRLPKRPVRAVKARGRRITGKQWATLEEAYRRPIETVRQAILDSLREYAVLERAESGGVSTRAVDKQLVDIREHTKALLAALTATGDTALAAHDAIEQAGVDLERLRGSLIVLDHAYDRMPDLRPHQKGDAWDAWVRGLSKICHDHDLPTGAAQDDDAEHKPSPFVAFVEKLQTFLPPRLRLHTYSRVALAGAINRARAARNA
jgi:hypothetical protein